MEKKMLKEDLGHIKDNEPAELPLSACRVVLMKYVPNDELKFEHLRNTEEIDPISRVAASAFFMLAAYGLYALTVALLERRQNGMR